MANRGATKVFSGVTRQQRSKASLASDLTNRSVTPRGNPLSLLTSRQMQEPQEKQPKLIGVGADTWASRAKLIQARLPNGLYALERADHFRHAKIYLDQDEELAYRHGQLYLRTGVAGTEQWRAARRECLAVSESCGLLDFSSLSRFMVEGPGASAMLQQLCTNTVAGPQVPLHALKYTMRTDAEGKVRGSMTVLKLGEEKYLLMCYALTSRLDWELLSASLPLGVSLQDVTWDHSLLMVTGPKTDAVLWPLMKRDCWDNVASLPNFMAMPVTLAGVSATLSRVSYCGGLGYELHVPKEGASKLYEELRHSSAAEVTEIGYTAMQVMRTEAARPCFTVDIPAGAKYLDCVPKFLAKLRDDQPDFRGKASITSSGPAEKFLVHLAAENPHYFMSCMNAAAPAKGGKHRLLLDGEDVGYVTSGFYGFRAGRAVMFALLDKRVDLGLTGKKALTSMGSGRLMLVGENDSIATSVSVIRDAEALISA